MKYNMTSYNNAVKYYKEQLGRCKNVLLVFELKNLKAFYSIAPLSQAVHELGADLDVFGIQEKSDVLQALYHAWLLYENPNKYVKPKETAALKAFIKSTKINGFSRLFIKPDVIIKATNNQFIGSRNLDFQPGWFKKFRWPMLLKTARLIQKQVINLKTKESLGIGFELMLNKKDMDKPIEDYLDSYAIAQAMACAAKPRRVSMSASTQRLSMLEPMTRISDLKATIVGCELSKNINEAVFRKFKKLSKFIHSDKIKINDANFFVSGKGYSGKHIFGQKIGYPDPDKKTRWQSPGMFIYKLDYFPQTKQDKRLPMSRVAFTDTLPIDVFIKSCNVDWLKMRRKNMKLKKIIDRSEKIIVRSNNSKTDFIVGLMGSNGHRNGRLSDIETRSKIKKSYLKETGIIAGTMANLPGGETFVTPEYVKGIIVGDVVISIDQSYRLDKNHLIIKSDKKGYKIISGSKKIIKKIKEKKKDSWKVLLKYEKNKSLPKKIINLKKKNFNLIGEFAINTNPKAELCDYLIVNEKIAGMVHIALGSGFDPDRSTVYHMDIVINAIRQKLDIIAISKKETYIMKNGQLMV